MISRILAGEFKLGKEPSSILLHLELIELAVLDVVFVSPEAVVSSQWRLLLRDKLCDSVCLLAVDEAHCNDLWGSEFRPAYRDLHCLRAFLKCPVMALSGTLPSTVLSNVKDSLLLYDPVIVSVSLDRPNLFYSLSKSTSIPSDLYSLGECLMTATLPEQVPKTVIFCLSKDDVLAVYTFLLKAASPCNRHFVGIYHASLTEHSRSVHQDRFSDGRERIIVSTSAFGMGVDVSDISLVICFGCPSNGLEFVQQIGRGGRQADIPCRCHLIWKGSEKKLDQNMLLLLSGNCCLRKWILQDVLESDEFTTDSNDYCCSVCSTCEPSSLFSLKPRPSTTRSPFVTRRVKRKDREKLQQELLHMRVQLAGGLNMMRGLNSVLSHKAISNVVKRCGKIHSVNDVIACGVLKDSADLVLQLVQTIVGQTNYHTPP